MVSSFNNNASATSWQLHPPSSSTKAFARRVKRDAAEPSRASAISSIRSSALRKPPRITPTSESINQQNARNFARFFNESGYTFEKLLARVRASLLRRSAERLRVSNEESLAHHSMS